MKQSYEFDGTQRYPIKSWTKGVLVEDKARQQLQNIASMPFIHRHVAAMPDVHWGRAQPSVLSLPLKMPSFRQPLEWILGVE